MQLDPRDAVDRMDLLTHFDARLGPLTVERFLGKGKSGRSYRVRSPAGPLVLEVAHDEVVPYSRFTRNKVEAYGRLRALGVRVPGLLEHDAGRGYLAINVSAESGKPRREGLEARVTGWCRASGVG